MPGILSWGAALSPSVNQLDTKRQILSAIFLSDPNFAHTHTALKRDDRDIGILVGSGAIGWAAWVSGTAIGALVAVATQPFVPTDWNIILAAIEGGLIGLMTNDALAWQAILTMAETVFALRFSGFAVMRYVRITPKVEVFVEKCPFRCWSQS